jgi:hypothetical protein
VVSRQIKLSLVKLGKHQMLVVTIQGQSFEIQEVKDYRHKPVRQADPAQEPNENIAGIQKSVLKQPS